MLRFGLPAVAWAGVLLAAVPVLLHLLTRRPGNPRVLPTARFLSPRTRSRLRLRRRPEDPGLLLLRVVLVLLVAGALAEPRWAPARSGSVEVLLLDRGRGMAAAWEEALGIVAERQAAREAERESLLLVPFVGEAEEMEPAGSDALERLLQEGPSGDAEGDYAAALAVLPRLPALLPGVDSVRAVLVTRPRWEGWGAGTSLARERWPGRIEVVAVGEGAEDPPGPEGGTMAPGREVGGGSGTETGGVERPRARVSAPGGQGGVVRAALGALGWEVDSVGADPPGLVVVVPEGPAREVPVDALREGATVVVATADPGFRMPEGIPHPWNPDGGAPSGGGDLVLAAGGTVRGAARRGGGGPAPGARLLAAWDDGRPAAASTPIGEGCLVYLATPLEEGELPLDPAFPELLAVLAAGCGPDESALPGGPLDRGALRLLEGAPGAPSRAALEALAGGTEGYPLARWLLAAALVAALAEWGWARRAEVRRAAGA